MLHGSQVLPVFNDNTRMLASPLVVNNSEIVPLEFATP